MAKSAEKKRKLETEHMGSNGTGKRVRANNNAASIPTPQTSKPTKDEKVVGNGQTTSDKTLMHETPSKQSQKVDSQIPATTSTKKLKIKASDALAEESHDGVRLSNGVVTKEKKHKKRKHEKSKANITAVVETNDNTANDWIFSSRTAGRFTNHDPIFVKDQDDEYLIAANTCEVQLLSLSGSSRVRGLPIPEGRRVVSYSLSAVSDEVVDIALDNGEKYEWLWTTGQVTKSSFPGRERVVSLTRTKLEDEKPEMLYIVQKSGSHDIVLANKLVFSSSQRLRHVQSVGQAAYIIATGANVIIIGSKRLATDAEYTWIELPVLQTITTIDARLVKLSGSKKSRATDLVLATGNEQGQIHVYSNLASLFTSGRQPQLPKPRILHWHRNPVSAIKFSKDGNYIISGGKETVLVLWQLETGQQQYLPHLTCEIERIVVSPDGTRYAMQMGDNSIMVISTSELKPVSHFPGLQLPVTFRDTEDSEILSPECAAVINPQDTNQLLLTVPSTQPKTTHDVVSRPFLQTFDIQTSQHLKRQALARNNVTDLESSPEGTKISPPDASLLSITADGQWLATVDEWIPPASDLGYAVSRTKDLSPEELAMIQEQQTQRREIYLKFWRWSAEQDLWTLSTRVDAPHLRSVDANSSNGAGRILQLVADPTSNVFATVGEDGQVKIWRPKTRTRHGVAIRDEAGIEMVEWTCRTTISLPLVASMEDKADSPMEDDEALLENDSKDTMAVDASLAFSEDGSLLACALTADRETAMPLVHLVSPLKGNVIASKAGLIPHGQEIEHLALIEHYIIAVSSEVVRVWNLVEDRHQWTVAFGGIGLESEDHESSLFSCNIDDRTFAVMHRRFIDTTWRNLLRVYSPRTQEALCDIDCEITPVALLSARGARGYTVLFEDGTIRKLASSLSSSIQPFASEAGDMQQLNSVTDQPLSSLIAPDGKAEVDNELLASQNGIDATEDDRPVVRPEQLAAIFDASPSFAMPPVKDMFAAVIELFGRKPLLQDSE